MRHCIQPAPLRATRANVYARGQHEAERTMHKRNVDNESEGIIANSPNIRPGGRTSDAVKCRCAGEDAAVYLLECVEHTRRTYFH